MTGNFMKVNFVVDFSIGPGVAPVAGGPSAMFSLPSMAATPVGADIPIDLLLVRGSI